MPRTITIISVFLLFLLWLSSRAFLYDQYWQDIIDINYGADSDSWHMWYLPAELIEKDFFRSMWLLRGEPPLPQFIAGLFIQFHSWPFTIPIDSFLMSALTLCSSYLIYTIVIQLKFTQPIALLAATSWLLHPSIMIAELEALPMVFYELLPCFLFLLVLYLLLHLQRQPRSKTRLFAFGIAMVVLACSRSTLSYIFVLPFMVLALVPSGKIKWFAASLAILLQLSLAFKNYGIYGEFHLTTSADVGQNIFSTVLNTDNLKNFYEFHAKRHPDNTFVNGLLKCGAHDRSLISCQKDPQIKHWQEKDNLLKEETRIGEKIYGESYFQSSLTTAVQPLFLEFLIMRPDRAIDMFYKSYRLFWGDTYHQVARINNLASNTLLQQLDYIYTYIKQAQIVIIHCFGIALFVIYFVVGGREVLRPNATMLGFIFCALSFSYVAVFSSLGDHGENPRYRIAVEAIVWLLPFFILRGWQQLLRKRQ